MTITVIDSPKCLKHNMAPEHPESPDRLHAIHDQLIASGLETVLNFENAVAASEQHLLLAHSPDFVRSIIGNAPIDKESRRWLDDDTLMMEHSLSAALFAAGAGIQAVDIACNKNSNAKVFCNVRPPGHHAGVNSAAGFCIFNNIAIAAKYALTHHKLSRVAIVDFDVHHGNGTQNIVQNDERILLLSSFQHPFYPFSGHEKTASNIVNTPIEAGTTGDTYKQKIAHWWPLLDKFQPELIFISAGFDAHAEDELGQLRLVEEDFAFLTKQIVSLANKHGKGRIVSMLEGGYALSALGRSVVAHINAMLD